MAGQPRRRAVEKFIAERIAEADDTELTALEWVASQIEDGMTLRALARKIAAASGIEDITAQNVTTALRLVFGRDVVNARLADARRDASHILVEEGREIIDDANETPAAVSKAKAQADIRTWIAERYNSNDFGRRGNGVTVNIGQLHLAALQQPASALAPQAQIAHPHAGDQLAPRVSEQVDFEIVTDAVTTETRDGANLSDASS